MAITRGIVEALGTIPFDVETKITATKNVVSGECLVSAFGLVATDATTACGAILVDATSGTTPTKWSLNFELSAQGGSEAFEDRIVPTSQHVIFNPPIRFATGLRVGLTGSNGNAYVAYKAIHTSS